MKKIWILCLVILLLGCNEAPKRVVEVEPEEEEEIEVEEKVEEVDYVDSAALKELVKLANKKTDLIDIAYLHERLSNVLLEEVDLDIDIDQQTDLIEEIVKDELYKWKEELVRDMLIEEQVSLNKDDFDTLVSRTSTYDAYRVMSVYEIVYLKKEVE